MANNSIRDVEPSAAELSARPFFARGRHCVLALHLCSMLLAGAFAADAPALDAKKYPQDTPRAAIESIVKALEAREIEYWISWLIVPRDRERIVQRHGSLLSAAIYNSDDKHMEKMKTQRELMAKMLERNDTTEGIDGDVKWVRYKEGDKIMQLELQPDGRWCMTTRIPGAAK